MNGGGVGRVELCARERKRGARRGKIERRGVKWGRERERSNLEQQRRRSTRRVGDGIHNLLTEGKRNRGAQGEWEEEEVNERDGRRRRRQKRG